MSSSGRERKGWKCVSGGGSNRGGVMRFILVLESDSLSTVLEI